MTTTPSASHAATTSAARPTPMRTRLLALTALLGVSSLAAGCSVFGLGGGSEKHFSADFTKVVGVYDHSDVRMLGVKIGQVTKITPEGNKVRVDMEYDASYKVPANATAVILAPSIVSDRYVQVTPIYTSGATLPDNAHLGLTRTEVPVELDDVYKNIDTLDQALGPNGANKNGALSDLLNVGAQNLKGNGTALNSTLTGVSQAVQTLANSRTDLFGTIANLQKFTAVIAANDDIVSQFSDDLDVVSGQLNGERTDLATAIKELASALGEVASFVHDNKDALTSNIKNLTGVTGVLVKEKAALREFLDTAPTALSNLQLAYNPVSGTLDTRDDSTAQGGLSGLLCNVLDAAGIASAIPCTTALKGLPGLPTTTKKVVPTTPVAPPDLTLDGILGPIS